MPAPILFTVTDVPDVVEEGREWRGRPLDDCDNYYVYDRNGHNVVMGMDRPTAEECNQILRGLLTIRIMATEYAMLLLFRFGSLRWYDAPYEWHKVHETRRNPRLDDRRFRAILVDTTTGLVRLIRTWEPDAGFVKAFGDAVTQQIDTPPNHEAADEFVARVRQKSPTELAEMCVRITAKADAQRQFEERLRRARDVVRGRPSFLKALGLRSRDGH